MQIWHVEMPRIKYASVSSQTWNAHLSDERSFNYWDELYQSSWLQGDLCHEIAILQTLAYHDTLHVQIRIRQKTLVLELNAYQLPSFRISKLQTQAGSVALPRFRIAVRLQKISGRLLDIIVQARWEGLAILPGTVWWSKLWTSVQQVLWKSTRPELFHLFIALCCWYELVMGPSLLLCKKIVHGDEQECRCKFKRMRLKFGTFLRQMTKKGSSSSSSTSTTTTTTSNITQFQAASNATHAPTSKQDQAALERVDSLEASSIHRKP